MAKLWQKHWTLDREVEAFETKNDIVCDRNLVTYDVLGSIAHAYGLCKIGILTADEVRSLVQGFRTIVDLYARGNFELSPGEEDIHTKIENFLTQSLGDTGKKIHTGRSRNDQVLTALRLYSKDRMLVLSGEVLTLVTAFLDFAHRHETMLMPGYTHMQKAMPSTLGMWAGAFVEGLLDDLEQLKGVYELNDQSPLGSAAGYGIPLPLPRAYTAELLGFHRVQINPMYCQNSRGKIEALIIAAFIAILTDINRFASDVMIFSTGEFAYFQVADELCSGSSIMPQKRNVDIAELLRSKVHVLLGAYQQIAGMGTNLMSGYNRDLQDTKKPFMESVELAIDTVHAATLLVKGITVNAERLMNALTPEIFATHRAVAMVKSGMPFRNAYMVAGKGSNSAAIDTAAVIQSSKHIGGTGNLGLDDMAKRYSVLSGYFSTSKHEWEKKRQILWKGGETS